MERFKIIEKEVKTKAFSKEGLSQAVKLDPKDAQKVSALNWLVSSKEKLNIQIDMFEARIEALSLKERQSKDSKVANLRKKVNRHKFYIETLENIHRLLGNDMITPNDVLDKKDDLEYYIEIAEDEEYDDTYDIFEDLNIKQYEVKKPVEDLKKSPPIDKPKELPKESPKQDIKFDSKLKGKLAASTKIEGTPVTVVPLINPIISNPKVASTDIPSFASAASLNLTKPKENSSIIGDSLVKLKSELKQVPKQSWNISKCLESAKHHMLNCNDNEKTKIISKQPYAVPPYYPSTPLSMVENPLFFEKLDQDTLFFIFYYQQSTIMQYFAAKELKKQSWRFHKRYMTWFQRLEEPKIITEEFEQGTYLYFDFESSWCQRKKSEFAFEYKFLEEELRL